MIHPYVIDTSVIFNASGIRGKKDSLKNLTLMHLNEKIQVGKQGHHPVEDCIATMKLVQLKLGNSLQYGDAVLENNSTNANKEVILEEIKSNQEDNKIENKINFSSDSSEKIPHQVEEVSNSKSVDGFFSKA
ncbi:RNA exonuclease 3, partial [Stegodyphus mimosarum]